MPEFRLVPTGVAGLDEMLQGGIPKGYTVLVSGGPGTGKTILGMQFLVTGALMGEPGLYVSLDEAPQRVRANMSRSFGWDMDRLEAEKLVAMVDATPIRLIPGQVTIGTVSVGRREFSIISLVGVIKSRAKEMGAKRIVVDPITTLVVHYPDEADRRYALMDLLQALEEIGETSMMISELRADGREYLVEEYLCQGVVLMRNVEREGSLVRAIQIEKMRGVPHDTQPRPYHVTREGIEVYPREKVL